MEWTVTIEGPDEFGEIQRAQVQIEKGFERLASGEIGLSIDDGKRIMSALQEFVVKEELATYALARRVCVSCERLRPVKDYTSRKIRTVFGTVVVKNPRWMVCQRCFPHFSMAFTVLGEICPDRATPELMELTARLGSMLPYRKAAELLAEFLPIEPTEGHQTVRKRTLTLGARLEDQSLRQERETPPLACERKQLELGMPDDPLREFVVSIDTAHIRSADQKTARDFEIVIARCGRGGRGMPPGHYFATSNTSQLEMRARTLQALQFEGYSGHGEVTILSDGAEIMKRLPKALPKPTTHIIDWFHLAMKIRPMQQIADHIVGSRPILCGILAVIDEEIKALKWKLWHGQLERTICALEKIIVDMDEAGTPGRFVCRPAQQPWSATSDLYPLQPDRACRLWREISSGAPHFDQPGGIRGQFLGCEKDGQKPANALVPIGRSSHAAGQSGDGERQSTTTAPAQARPAYAAPPPDLSTNPAFAQSRIKPQSFCRSLVN